MTVTPGTQRGAVARGHVPRAGWLAWWAIAALWVSVALVVTVSLQGPSAAVPKIPAIPGWLPYSGQARPSAVLVSLEIWTAIGVGGLGLTAGLVAVRRGWRPRPRRLIIGSVIAVVALMLMPPVGSTDMLDYAVYGRIAALGHSPYLMTPAQLRSSGDQVGAVAPDPWQRDPSVYGPIGTATEWAAAKLAGASAARMIFWLKVWDALAFLAVVLALDRFAARDETIRARAHLLWSVNPLMLFAVMAGGHVDGLAASFGTLGLLALRKVGPGRGLQGQGRGLLAGSRVAGGLLAGALVGAATAIKAPFALFAVGLGWAARRSPRALAAIGAGAAAVLVPGYLLAGPAAVAAVARRAAGGADLYEPWQLLTRALGWHHQARLVDTLALLGSVLLAVILLWRMPAGPGGLASVRPVLAVTLAWLICSPQQRPWFDAMIFPLLALMPATRLDWIVTFRAVAAALAELPGVTYYVSLHPVWLFTTANTISRWAAPGALTVAVVVLLGLCITNRWTPASGRDGPVVARSSTGARWPFSRAARPFSRAG